MGLASRTTSASVACVGALIAGVGTPVVGVPVVVPEAPRAAAWPANIVISVRS